MSTIYLYVKQHKITGLLYFGKTTNKYPEKYLGGGTVWRRHLNKNGKFIDTLCIWEFNNQEKCTEFALQFSKENDIVKNKKWANLREENGLDGNIPGLKLSKEQIIKLQKPKSIEARKNNSIAQKLLYENGYINPNKNKKRTDQTKKLLSDIAKKRFFTKETRQKMCNNHSKNWLIFPPDKSEFVINNLQKFCQENDLRSDCITRRKGSKGWFAKKLID